MAVIIDLFATLYLFRLFRFLDNVFGWCVWMTGREFQDIYNLARSTSGSLHRQSLRRWRIFLFLLFRRLGFLLLPLLEFLHPLLLLLEFNLTFAQHLLFELLSPFWALLLLAKALLLLLFLLLLVVLFFELLLMLSNFSPLLNAFNHIELAKLRVLHALCIIFAALLLVCGATLQA